MSRNSGNHHPQPINPKPTIMASVTASLTAAAAAAAAPSADARRSVRAAAAAPARRSALGARAAPAPKSLQAAAPLRSVRLQVRSSPGFLPLVPPAALQGPVAHPRAASARPRCYAITPNSPSSCASKGVATLAQSEGCFRAGRDRVPASRPWPPTSTLTWSVPLWTTPAPWR